MKRGILIAGALAAPPLLFTLPPAHAADRFGGAPAPAFSTTSLPDAEFTKLHRAIVPGKERWAEIPWETDLAAARARSGRDGRPLLMWIMDGHPLGCT